jgi:hypothetical protein
MTTTTETLVKAKEAAANAQATGYDVTQAKAAEVATQEDGFSEFGGQGLENLGRDDLAIPFLVILQAGSPQVKRSEGDYIEGAYEGMLFNTVTKQVVDPAKDGLTVVPCFYDRNFVEWRVRESGGGFVAQHETPQGLKLQADAMRDDKNRDILPNGHQINDTRTFLCLAIYGDGSTSPVFITLTSTQIKKARQWLMQQSLLKLKAPNGNLYTPPMFASRWTVTTVPESNERGSWMGWAFTHAGYLKGPKDPLFVEAQALHKSMAEGTVKADLSKSGVEPESNGTGGNGKNDSDDKDDDIPF